VLHRGTLLVRKVHRCIHIASVCEGILSLVCCRDSRLLETFAARFVQQNTSALGVADLTCASRYVADELKKDVSERISSASYRQGELCSVAVLDPLPWDSKVFRMKMGRISWLLAAGEPEQRRAARNEVASEIVRLAGEHRYQHLMARVATSDFEGLHALESVGFRTMDVQVTLSRAVDPADEKPIMPPQGVEIGLYRDSDLAILRQLSSKAYQESRFFADPSLPPGAVEELHREWVTNDCRGRAAAVFVAHIQGEPVGYIACLLIPEQPQYGLRGHGDIDLITVGPAARGRNIGMLLVNASLAWFTTHTDFVTVKTQVTNFPALALYSRTGFRLTQASTTLHRALASARQA
jgi:ribosomal protein S18 acetylase RimI-like enzyme